MAVWNLFSVPAHIGMRRDYNKTSAIYIGSTFSVWAAGKQAVVRIRSTFLGKFNWTLGRSLFRLKARPELKLSQLSMDYNAICFQFIRRTRRWDGDYSTL